MYHGQSSLLHHFLDILVPHREIPTNLERYYSYTYRSHIFHVHYILRYILSLCNKDHIYIFRYLWVLDDQIHRVLHKMVPSNLWNSSYSGAD